jgi:hypothetical protein
MATEQECLQYAVTFNQAKDLRIEGSLSGRPPVLGVLAERCFHGDRWGSHAVCTQAIQPAGGTAVSYHVPEHDPRSPLEDEGIPDLEEGAPQQQWAVDPQRAPVPGDSPAGVDEYGTTASEEAMGESWDRYLARERPDPIVREEARADDTPAARVENEVAEQPDIGIGGGPLSESGESLVRDAPTGPIPTMDDRWLDADFGSYPGDDAGFGNPPQPEEPIGRVWDGPRPAGRLVAPDEGAHPDIEPDEVAEEEGPDFGGYTAEEAAMRVDPE